MLYNKQVFKDNNLEVPTTWDEFISVCDTLKGNDITPIAFGNSQNWYTMWYVGQFNASYVNADTRTADYNPTSGEFTDRDMSILSRHSLTSMTADTLEKM